MRYVYDSKKQSVWSRLQQDSDIDELIYGAHPAPPHDVAEEEEQ